MIRVAVLAMCAALACACAKKEKDPEAAAPDQGNVAAAPLAVPSVPAPTEDDGALVARGEYLAQSIGCPVCHTPMGPTGPDFSKALAGGLEIPEKFGTWRSPNITQDKETGIGSWTDEQIAAAIRQGRRPDGTQLFPIMPYLFYNQLSDSDTKALVAYLRTVEPISNKVERATDLKLPAIPAPEPKGAEPPPTGVEHGRYLAGLLHCAMCHTPMDDKGMPDQTKFMAGGFEFEMPMFGEGVLYSANITPDKETGVGAWTDAELVAAIQQMKTRDGKLIRPPMALYQGGWAQMKESDVKDIVAYLRTVQPVEHKVPESTFKMAAGPPAAKH